MTSSCVITETIFISDPHAQASAFRLFDDVDGERPAGQVAREPFGALHVVGRHRLLAVGGEARVHPTEERAQELFRQPLGAVQALEHAASKDLFHEPRVEVRELQEMLKRRFDVACARLLLSRSRPPLDTSRFCVPGRAGRQRALFAETNSAMREAKPS